MKLSRDFLWGIGAGLILSALFILGVNAVLDQDNTSEKQVSESEQQSLQTEESPEQNDGLNTENELNKETETESETESETDQNANIGENIGNEANQGTQKEQKETVKANEEGSINTETVVVTVPPGSTSEDVCKLLVRHGVIKDHEAFNNYILQQGKATKLQIGTFVFPPGLTKAEILDILTK